MAEDSLSTAVTEIKEITERSSGPQKNRFRKWVVPVVTALALTSVFLVYYFVYVTSQREYLANRNFRSLAVLGDQIQAAVSAHGSILEFYADLARENNRNGARGKGQLSQFLVIRREDQGKKGQDLETRRDYLKFLAPGFELRETPAEQQSKARFEVERSNGNWQLVLTAERHQAARPHSNVKDYTGSLELQQLMQPITATLPFDDILLVSEKGDVIYQQKKAGPQFTTLSSLLEAQAETPPAKEKPSEQKGKRGMGKEPETVAHNLDEAWQSRSMHLTDVTLAGTRYKLFLQPVLVDAFSDDPDGREPAREWVVCGLRSATALEWEALSISYTVIIWFTVVFFAIAMSGPILKIFLINRREHWKAGELASLGLFAVLLTSVFTFSALEATGFPLNDDTETELIALENRLSGAVHHELAEMRQQLVSWCGSDQFRGKSDQIPGDATLAEQREVIRNSPPEDSQARAAGRAPEPSIYPYAGNAFWTNDDGQQIIKWSTGRYVTPMIDLSGQAVYTHPKETYLDGKGPPFHFASVLPPNKLGYLGVLAIGTEACVKEAARQAGTGPMPKKIREDIAGGSAFLSAEPLSMVDPILPAGYGFAVIDNKGAVLFHTDKTRNLHENFFEESDWSRSLYSASFSHASNRSLSLHYKGQDYRARVTGIPGLSEAPWSLIVYRDLTGVRTLNLQAITMASTLLLAFLAGPIIWMAVWWVTHRPRHAPEWLWPHGSRSETYRLQSWIYGGLAVAYLIAGFTGSAERRLLASAALPYAIFLATFWCFHTARAAPKTARKRRALPAAPLAICAIGVLGAGAAMLVPWGALKLTAVFSGGAVIAAATLLERPRRFLTARWTALQAPSPPEQKATDRVRASSQRWRGHYTTALLLATFLTGVMMPMALFQASVKVEWGLQLKQAQLHLAVELERRLLRTIAACEEGDLSKAACDQFEETEKSAPGNPAATKAGVWNRIVFDPLFPAGGYIPYKPHSDSAQSTEMFSPWLQSVMYFLHHDYNQGAAETLGVIPDRVEPSGRRGGSGPDWSWKTEGPRVTLRWHGIHLPVEGDAVAENDLLIESELPQHRPSDALTGVGVAVLVMLIMATILSPLVRKVFLFHIAAVKLAPSRQAAEAIREGRNVAVLAPMISDWRVEEPKWTLEVADLARTPGWAESFDVDTIPPHTVVEIRGFEYTAGDPSVDAEKSKFLQRLLNRPGTQIAVIAKVAVSAEDYRRVFPNCEIFDLRDEPFYWLAQYEGPNRDLLWKECRNLPALWPLGAQLAKDFGTQEVHSPDTIAFEVLERADPYYRMIWKECSSDQKFALAQLAADGVPNPANGRALGQLIRRGLILTIPQFRVVNESFRRFLRSAPTPDERREWRRQSLNSGWGKLHVAFFIALALAGTFLLTTQNALWQSSAGYVTTAFGALGTIAKLFNIYRGPGAPPTEKAG